jgi:phage/plasmid-like protein (TIGR03299 family)
MKGKDKMSHNIERLEDGTYSMAYAGETPWHGLGKEVHNDLTPNQMLKEACLDWEVEKVPAFYTYNGKKIMTGQQALVRSSDGKLLSNVSDDWEPNQNRAAFDFFNDFIMEGDMSMESAGSLNDGRIVWALAKVKESFTVFGKDKIESFLLFSNPHQYGKSIDIRFTPIRVVCNNTLTLSLHGKADMMVRLNHRHAFDADDVKATLGIASTKLGTYKEMAQFLGSKKYTDKTLVEYLSQVFPTNSAKKKEENVLSRPAQIAHDIVLTQPGAEYAPGSFWQAFNTATFTIDHLLGHSDNNRLYSSWYGNGRKKKVAALELACDMAKVA